MGAPVMRNLDLEAPGLEMRDLMKRAAYENYEVTIETMVIDVSG